MRFPWLGRSQAGTSQWFGISFYTLWEPCALPAPPEPLAWRENGGSKWNWKNDVNMAKKSADCCYDHVIVFQMLLGSGARICFPTYGRFLKWKKYWKSTRQRNQFVGSDNLAWLHLLTSFWIANRRQSITNIWTLRNHNSLHFSTQLYIPSGLYNVQDK